MSKHGDELLADLRDLTTIGTSVLPDAADSIWEGYLGVPVSISEYCGRSGGIGFGANGPGAALDSVIDKLNSALMQSTQNTRDTATAILWIRDQFAATDETCAQYFHVKMHALGAK